MSDDQIKEIREAHRLKYNKKIEQEEIENKKLDNIRLQKERHENERQEELMCKKHQEYLDSLDALNKESNCPENNIPINESVIIISSIFEEQSFDFVQNSIINYLYDSINKSNFDELYIFYISIKEISSTYDKIYMELILNTLLLIKMNPHFIEILNESNKLEFIKIIFQEFIKIIDFIKPELNNSIN